MDPERMQCSCSIDYHSFMLLFWNRVSVDWSVGYEPGCSLENLALNVYLVVSDLHRMYYSPLCFVLE